jgi:hypothetical protein
MKRFRLLVCVIVVVVASQAIAVLPPLLGESGSMCARIQAWVAENIDNLPETMAEFQQYPVEYQRRIYNHLSQETKTRMWQQRYRRYAIDDSLSVSQRAVVAEAEEMVNGGRMLGPDNESARNSLLVRIQATFSPQLAVRVFSLSSSSSVPTGLSAARVRIAEFLRGSLSSLSTTLHAGEDPPCYCASTLWCQTVSGSPAVVCYNYEGEQCEPTPEGCGLNGESPCIGICQLAWWEG